MYIELPQVKLHRSDPECQGSDKLLEVEAQHLHLGAEADASLCLLTQGVPDSCDSHLAVTHQDRLLSKAFPSLQKVFNTIVTESQINTAMRKLYCLLCSSRECSKTPFSPQITQTGYT